MLKRSVCTIGAAFTLVLLLTGCGGPGTPTPTPSPSPTTPAPSPTPSEEPTPEPTEDPDPNIIALPTACTDLFSSEFIRQMEDAHYPLNHPGITMAPTELVAGQSVLAREPALHCTWGAPSETGVATVVALITREQRLAMIDEAWALGFTCGAGPALGYDGADSDNLYSCVYAGYEDTPEFGEIRWGEHHIFRGNAWIGTAYLNFETSYEYFNHIYSRLWPGSTLGTGS